MADIWVWPWSRSNVFWEAAACWLPLILEDREYTRELVYEWENWFLLECWDKESLCSILKSIPALDYKKMWLSSRKIIEDGFSWRIINSRFLR